MDHLLPLYVRAAGGLVVYTPDAVANDRPISGLREQFRNRTRTATRGIRSNLSMAARLAPWRHPAAALAIWSHKILRWATVLLLAWACAGSGLLAAYGQREYLALPAGLLVGLAAAAAGQLVASSGRRPILVLAIARSFAIVNLAFGLAWVNVLRGRRIDAWQNAEWSSH